ncbi:MAG: hypothetical protein DID92_2727745644 [Candidatus Nitrotoga sp. SPKER]|nr:MAG: hypothetical protein DID92_2727745644 [Candidatus Nitrotoga sp. SPKER]
MREFIKVNLANSAPDDGICPACATHGIFHKPTQTRFVYCKHNLTGASQSSNRPWKVFSKIEATTFRAAVLRGVLAGELRIEIVPDIKSLIIDETNHSVKH